jgi:hypothetical protein
MAQTVLKTFRLPTNVVREIEEGAKSGKVSQAQYIVSIVSENKFLKLKKSFEDDVKKMKKDKAYRKEQVDLADSDFM